MGSRTYCIDSDVLIWQLRNSGRRTSVTAHLTSLAESGTLACSVLSVAEVEQGVRPGEEAKTRALLSALACYPVDREIAEHAGEIVRSLRSRGETLGLADALIAATCLTHGLVLVTLNGRDFGKVPSLVIESVP